MIVIDTSALVAILNHEPERKVFFEAIATADRRLVSAVARMERSAIRVSLVTQYPGLRSRFPVRGEAPLFARQKM